jgi:Fur family transcriptional regulator, zinc uptake regulator
LTLRRQPFALDGLVYALIAQSGRALTAYEMVAALRTHRHQVAPQQVYRIIRRLEAERRIRRIESVQAYCICDPAATPPALVVCEGCHKAEAATGIDEADLHPIGRTSGFDIQHAIIEAVGTCPDCRDENGRQGRAY